MSADLSPASGSDLGTRLEELTQHITRLEAQIQTIDQQLTTASGDQRAELEQQLRSVVAEHGVIVEEANGLRNRLGVPVVVPVVPLPSIMTDQPQGGAGDQWATTQDSEPA